MMKRRRWQFIFICVTFVFLSSNSYAGAWLPTKMEMDADADGNIDSIIYYLYDSDGRTIELRSDNDADGIMDSISYNTYDKDGYTVISEQDLDADGSIDSVIYSSLSTDGNISITEYDNDADGTIDSHYYSASDGGCPVMTNKLYEGIGAYAGSGTLTTIIYNTYDSNCNIVKEEEDDDLDGKIDEITYTTYDNECRPITDKVDSNNDGKFDQVGQYTYDEEGLMLRSEVDSTIESYGISVTGKDVMDFENTYDGYGNVIKIESHLHSTRTMLGTTTETDSYATTYNTYEYFEGVESDESDDGCNNNGCCGNADGDDNDPDGVAPVSMGITGSLETSAPVTISVSVLGTSGETLYYKFFCRANYGTATYEASPWVVMQEYSTSSTCQYTFPDDGLYIVVVRTVTDPNDEPADLPIIGGVVAIGSSGQILLSGLSSDAGGDVTLGNTATYTVSGSISTGDTIYYKWFYRAGYGTSDYDSSPWVVAQDYSTSNSCGFSFPSAGKYIVVVRAVTDPNNEPADLPIIGGVVTVE